MSPKPRNASLRCALRPKSAVTRTPYALSACLDALYPMPFSAPANQPFCHW